MGVRAAVTAATHGSCMVVPAAEMCLALCVTFVLSTGSSSSTPASLCSILTLSPLRYKLVCRKQPL